MHMMTRRDSDDPERTLDRDIEREPLYGKRQRIPLHVDGAVKQWWQERQRIAKVRP
jgi:hypothetical protein